MSEPKKNERKNEKQKITKLIEDVSTVRWRIGLLVFGIATMLFSLGVDIYELMLIAKLGG